MTGTSRIELAQEVDEIVVVRRLEQPFGVAAALEPDQRRERRVGRQLAADLRHGRDGAHLLRPRVADAVGERRRPIW